MTSLGLPGQDFDDLLYGIGSDDLNDFEEEIQHDERNALLDRDEDGVSSVPSSAYYRSLSGRMV
jgi:hypothetical protein